MTNLLSLYADSAGLPMGLNITSSLMEDGCDRTAAPTRGNAAWQATRMPVIANSTEVTDGLEDPLKPAMSCNFISDL